MCNFQKQRRINSVNCVCLFFVSTKSSYQKPAHPSPEKHSEGFNREPVLEMPTHVGKDMTSFLQKLREAVQPKPAK